MAKRPEKCTVWRKLDQLQLIEPEPVTLMVTFDSKAIAGTREGDKMEFEAFLSPKPPPTVTPGPAIKAKVVANDNGTYSVSFPQASVCRGPCVLSIELNGRNIRESPFYITLLRHIQCIKVPKGYLKFTEQTGKFTQHGELWGVAVSSNGKIFVSDHSHHKIHVFNKERQYIKSFGTEGNGQGQLHRPQGLAVGPDGLVYVATASRIEVFTEDGESVGQIKIGIGDKPPWNVTIHKQHLYIADYSNGRVSVYTLQGQHVRTIGSLGNGPGQFNRPTGVAFSPDGDMYVTDGSNKRVQVFDADGHYKSQFGQDQLTYPIDIVITSDGDVLVADQSNNHVAVYSTTGNTKKGSFKVDHPHGLAIDKDGDILVTVTESGNKRVAVC